MSNTPSDFDFKFLPDWMKEEPAKNLYANYEGEELERPRREFRKPGPGNRDHKRKEKRDGDSRPRRDSPPERNRPRADGPEAVTQRPAQVNVEFLPDQDCAVAFAKQIKASARAYPLFDVARVFLGKPERHKVKISTVSPSAQMFQCTENGPVSFDRQSMEKNAFQLCKQLYYTEETVKGEAPKGNYSNVARCGLSGTLLGPTNHHAYQPSLRRLYEERFSRRMSFPDYQRQVQVVTAPEVIEAWKEQARSTTSFKTIQEPESLILNSVADADQHFRAHYLEKCLRSGNSFVLTGDASRNLQDRDIALAVRQAWENENHFPGQLMNHLRREFIHSGLYIFKHRNRVQLVSGIRPTHFSKTQQTLSDTITEILRVIAGTPKCTRAELCSKIIEIRPDDPVKTKSLLAADLHWLTHAGHVIEMHNGILELPVISNPDASNAKRPENKPATSPARPREAQNRPPDGPDGAAEQKPQDASVDPPDNVTLKQSFVSPPNDENTANAPE